MNTSNLEQAPTWRQQPYRVLFPLGVVLAWAGVLPWLLFGLGAGAYRSDFHPFAQIQGFMICFAVGFLFTMIPRRTKTNAPSPGEMALVIAMPIASTVLAWMRYWTASQVCWLILISTLMVFAVRRFHAAQAGKGPPRSFVGIPIAILMGLVGSLLVIANGLELAISPELYLFGRLLLFQGLFLGLVLGVGGMLLPLIICGESPPVTSGGDRRARLLHLAAALGLVATFVVEAFLTPRLGLALRALLVAGVLVFSCRIHLTPRRAGSHRWLVWLSAWCIPLGYLLTALWPDHVQLGLHVVFIGGFAQMALVVGLHVTLAHAKEEGLAFGQPWQVPVLGVLLLGAMVFRGLVMLVPSELTLWLGWSAVAFLLATLVWASLVLPLATARAKSQ